MLDKFTGIKPGLKALRKLVVQYVFATLIFIVLTIFTFGVLPMLLVLLLCTVSGMFIGNAVNKRLFR